MKKLLLLAIYVFIARLLFAQSNDILIKTSYNNWLFTEFVLEIEDNYPVSFFYDSSSIHQIRVKQDHISSTLDNILKQTFHNTDISYLIDLNGNIIITKNYIIRTEIQNSLLTANSKQEKTTTTAEISIDYLKKELNTEKKSNISGLNGRVKIGNPTERKKSEKAVLTGYIRSNTTGEPIIGAVIFSEDLSVGCVSDPFGYYVLELPRDEHKLTYKCVGYKVQKIPIELNANGGLNIDLVPEIIKLRGVVVTAEKEHNISGLQVGLNKLEISTIKQIPTSMGESDLVKSAILLPGIQTIGEGASGFNVRGSGDDQNLVLLDGSPLYNTSHLFGFFSVFNPDVVKEFKLYKSGIPTHYGGRLASVFDVSTVIGNRKEITGSGGISPVSARFAIEGPFIKDKASFIFSGRSTYSDWILSRIKIKNIQNSSASFYDLNTNLSYDINDRNSINVSAYASNDDFKLNSDTNYNYKNTLANIRWKHSFTKKLYLIFSGIYSHYSYSINSDKNPFNAFDLSYFINHKEFKADFSWFALNNHSVRFGANSILYNLNPGSLFPLGDSSLNVPQILPDQRGIESAMYISDAIRVNSLFSIDLGLRLSMYNALGPATTYQYETEITSGQILRSDSTVYGKNQIIKTFGKPEYRLTARYKTGLTSSIKFSYNRLFQYLHRLSNTAAVSPIDSWYLSGDIIVPQSADQVAIGFYKNVMKNKVESSVEVYYKKIKNLLEYKQGAELMLNKDIYKDLLWGMGRAYGIELMLKKKFGHLNGWVSYTYSRSENRVKGNSTDETINNGEFYPSNYDKPHDFTFVSNYKFSRRLNISNNFTYSTGRPITYPVAKYEFDNKFLLHYSNRNEYRIKDYLRWDLSINVDGNLKSKKLAHSSFSFSIYNLTGRRNIYSVFFKTDDEGNIKGYTMSIFSRPIVTITYNFKF